MKKSVKKFTVGLLGLTIKQQVCTGLQIYLFTLESRGARIDNGHGEIGYQIYLWPDNSISYLLGYYVYGNYNAWRSDVVIYFAESVNKRDYGARIIPIVRQKISFVLH